MRLTLLVGALVACGSGDDGDGDSGETADAVTVTLELGLGATDFGEASDGDSVTLVHGAQGGWHIDTAVRMCGGGTAVQLTAIVQVISTGEYLAGSQELDVSFRELRPAGANCGEVAGLRAFLDDFGATLDTIRDLDGEALLLRMEGVDSDSGATAADEVELIAELDPVDVEV